jgi:hypothetical protein
MNARTMNPTATLAAMMLTLVLVAPVAAAPSGGAAERAKSAPNARVVAAYSAGAWLVPTAVILHSAGQWKSWNDRMTADGLLVAPEAEPAGVNWAKESVVVLSTGELSESYVVELKGSRPSLRGVELELYVERGRGGWAPALVVAVPRSNADAVTVTSNYSLSLPEVRAWQEPALATADDEPMPVAMSWGGVKAQYR